MTPHDDLPVGRKDDFEKRRWDLLPWKQIGSVVDVLTYGAAKYDADNWRRVPDACRRYFAAMQRHLTARLEGEVLDPETGMPHLAHACCCLIFMLALDPEDGPLF